MNTNPNQIQHPGHMKPKVIIRDWFATIRLVCYAWLLVVLYLLNYYEPNFQALIEPCLHITYFLMGACLGGHGRRILVRK